MNLRVFCEPDVDYNRFAIHDPWVFDGWEYATDGKIAVRVRTAKRDSGPKDFPYPRARDLFAKFPKCLRTWPKWDRSLLVCRECNGVGRYMERTCPRCCGEKKIKAPVGVWTSTKDRLITTIGHHHFDAFYLGLIESQCKRLRYHLPRNENKPLAFTAAGGVQGLLSGVVK